jgi:DNA-binding transcriptional MerR regulator
MSTMRIAEVAERTGLPASTLRYYEDIGLLAPAERTANGYRAYSARDVERLGFVTRAKQLGIGLDDVRELLVAWDGDDCGDVQERLAGVVAARLAETQERLAGLVELAAHLQSAAARLAEPTRHGACDDGCACSTASAAAATTTPAAAATTTPAAAATTTPATEPTTHPTPGAVPLTRAESGGPIACTLEPGAVRGRVADWQAVLSRATGRAPIPGGASLTFGHDADLTAELARLAAAEQACCTFYDFTIAVTATAVRLEVRAPAEGQPLVAALFGPTGAP